MTRSLEGLQRLGHLYTRDIHRRIDHHAGERLQIVISQLTTQYGKALSYLHQSGHPEDHSADLAKILDRVDRVGLDHGVTQFPQ